jgi:hypothetical protein
LPGETAHRTARISAKTVPPAREDPRSGTEKELAKIWRDLLPGLRAGIRDGFFDIGGHSLLAIRLIAKVRSAFGVELPMRAVFESPTIAGLSRVIDEARTAAAGVRERTCLVPIQPLGSRPPLFCVHGFGGGVAGYYGPARLLGTDQPVYGLEAAGLSDKTCERRSSGTIEILAVDFQLPQYAMQQLGTNLLGAVVGNRCLRSRCRIAPDLVAPGSVTCRVTAETTQPWLTNTIGCSLKAFVPAPSTMACLREMLG